jgi:hypothetical protein
LIKKKLASYTTRLANWPTTGAEEDANGIETCDRA